MRFFLKEMVLIGCLAFFLSACDSVKNFKFSQPETEDEYPQWDAKKFHQKARQAMDAENYQKAIKLYEALESRYPFGNYAAQTQLDIAYAYFKNGDSEAAIAAIDRFIKVNPRNPHIDYAYYLRGLVNFNRSIGFIDRFLPTDVTQRNPSNVNDAYADFQQLVERFPNSQYRADAKQRMIGLRNNRAMYEVHVAQFYLKRGAYIAAANRGRYVLNNYPNTPAVPYALQAIQKAYQALKLDDLAADIDRVYQQNFPNGPPVAEYQQDTFVQQLWDFFGLDQ